MRNSSGSVTAPAMPPSAASTLFDVGAAGAGRGVGAGDHQQRVVERRRERGVVEHLGGPADPAAGRARPAGASAARSGPRSAGARSTRGRPVLAGGDVGEELGDRDRPDRVAVGQPGQRRAHDLGVDVGVGRELARRRPRRSDGASSHVIASSARKRCAATTPSPLVRWAARSGSATMASGPPSPRSHRRRRDVVAGAVAHRRRRDDGPVEADGRRPAGRPRAATWRRRARRRAPARPTAVTADTLAPASDWAYASESSPASWREARSMSTNGRATTCWRLASSRSWSTSARRPRRRTRRARRRSRAGVRGVTGRGRPRPRPPRCAAGPGPPHSGAIATLPSGCRAGGAAMSITRRRRVGPRGVGRSWFEGT